MTVGSYPYREDHWADADTAVARTPTIRREVFGEGMPSVTAALDYGVRTTTSQRGETFDSPDLDAIADRTYPSDKLGTEYVKLGGAGAVALRTDP